MMPNEVYTAEVLAVVCPTCKGVNQCLEKSLWGSKFIDKPHQARVGLAAQLKEQKELVPIDLGIGGYQQPS